MSEKKELAKLIAEKMKPSSGDDDSQKWDDLAGEMLKAVNGKDQKGLAKLLKNLKRV